MCSELPVLSVAADMWDLQGLHSHTQRCISDVSQRPSAAGFCLFWLSTSSLLSLCPFTGHDSPHALLSSSNSEPGSFLQTQWTEFSACSDYQATDLLILWNHESQREQTRLRIEFVWFTRRAEHFALHPASSQSSLRQSEWWSEIYQFASKFTQQIRSSLERVVGRGGSEYVNMSAEQNVWGWVTNPRYEQQSTSAAVGQEQNSNICK